MNHNKCLKMIIIKEPGEYMYFAYLPSISIVANEVHVIHRFIWCWMYCTLCYNTSCECSTYAIIYTFCDRDCFFHLFGCIWVVSHEFYWREMKKKNALASARFPFVLLILIDKMVLVIIMKTTHKHTHVRIYIRECFVRITISSTLNGVRSMELCEIFIWHIIKILTYKYTAHTHTAHIHVCINIRRRNFFIVILSCHVNIKHSTWIVKYPKLKLTAIMCS